MQLSERDCAAAVFFSFVRGLLLWDVTAWLLTLSPGTSPNSLAFMSRSLHWSVSSRVNLSSMRLSPLRRGSVLGLLLSVLLLFNSVECGKSRPRWNKG